MGLMSRLDMNTCQTSIKTDILYNIAEVPSLVLQTIYENTLSPNTELNKRGGSSSDIVKDLPNT